MKFNRFSDCELICEHPCGVRVLRRGASEDYFIIGPSRVYRDAVFLVQKHCRSFGIGYWKTVVRMREEENALLYCDLLVFGIQQGLEK